MPPKPAKSSADDLLDDEMLESDSEWDAANEGDLDDMSSINGDLSDDGSETIGSTSTADEADHKEDMQEASRALTQRKLIKKTAKSKPPSQPLLDPADKPKPAPDKKRSNGPRIVKYSATSKSGTVGRALNNAEVLVPTNYTPETFASVKAYQSDPPSTLISYYRVETHGKRNRAVYRAFKVKKGTKTTFYVLSNAEDDADALERSGVTPSVQLAKVAALQHKMANDKAAKLFQTTCGCDASAFEWPDDVEGDGITFPPIMCPELTSRLKDSEQPVSVVTTPKDSKKRKADDEDSPDPKDKSAASGKKPEPAQKKAKTKQVITGAAAAAVPDFAAAAKRIQTDMQMLVGVPLSVSINFTSRN